MIVFLKKVRIKTVFSIFEPIVTEPLELCYLKSVLNNMDIESYIIDKQFGLKEPLNVIPSAVVLTGYNVAENEIIKEAGIYKTKYPKAKIIVGGVHAQINFKEFLTKEIDYICHTQSLNTFKELIKNIMNGDDSIVEGVNLFHKSAVHEHENTIPDRTLFYKMPHMFRYLEKKNVALIKGSTSCPYNCSYCFCKLLNYSYYIKADYKRMIQEMESIQANYFWIIDDVLFTDRIGALEFIGIIKKKELNLKIIGYLRADFILREKDLLPALRKAGLTEVIVGFEATNNEELKGYEKTTNALNYPEVISLLKENNIDLTALFMVKPDYRIKDFKNLYKFLKNNKIEVYTISILTPIKGTIDYELLKKKLTTLDPRKFDFLHLVLKPNLPKWMFYLLFYSVHARLLKSKRVWKYLLNSITNRMENI
ncbi:B12-binding domain-containing radical SAM protein [Sedimentibacter sp. MB31-C6]|uniref:B12-binding domain-containing radical SAM protein n=1 Tax=Sedimentibacter sp. MB31-C6 TaxID=3109366 RepID=UPI002DDCA25E|nr:radical SAM protein [Sedimentibacter sp. MB36-C1]WSI02905.1 radical SAM protein [Sedimentibacter sp. MB36-C1]